MRPARGRLASTLLGASALVLLVCGVAQAASGQWISDLAMKESGGNQFQTNPYSTAIGSYQMTEAALVSAGYATRNGPVTAADYNGNDSNLVFTGKDGVNSVQDFMSNQAAQTNAAETYAKQVYGTISSDGTVSRYMGQTVNGQVLNRSAMLSGAYVLGPKGFEDYLANGGKVYTNGVYNPTLTAEVQSRIADGSQYNSSAITGGYTPVPNSEPGANTNPVTPTTVASSLYCNPYVSKLLVEGAKSYIDQAKAEVLDPSTGYTLLNGNSVAQAAGLAPGGSSVGGSTGTFGEFGCLSNLLGGNLNVLFEPPNLSAILQQLKNAVCSAAQGEMSKLVQPISSALFSNTNLGGFFPGLGLGALAGSLSTSASTGGGNGFSVHGGIGSSTTWYSSTGSPGKAQVYFNGLLGGSQ